MLSFIFKQNYFKPNEFEFRFSGIECSSSNKSATSVWCNIKPYSRTIAFLNFGFTFVKPINKIYVRFLTS